MERVTGKPEMERVVGKPGMDVGKPEMDAENGEN